MFEYKYRVSSQSYVPQSTMQPLSIATHDCIVTLLKSGASGYAIHHATGASTGAISKSIQSTVLSFQSPLVATLASSPLLILIMLSI